MKVRMQIYVDGRLVEEYTAPAGSWVATEVVGMQLVPAVLKRAAVEGRDRHGVPVLIVYEPMDPPYVPERLLKMVNGRDRRWGRNGWAWIGRHQQRYGGTPLDRAREYAAKFEAYGGDDWPVLLSQEEIDLILERKRPEGPVARPASPAVDLGQLPLFGERE